MSVILKDLRLQLGNFKLGPLSFESAESGVHLVRGSNGSGKTSLLRMLMGRLPSFSGTIEGVSFPLGSVGVEPLMMGSWSVRENINWFSDLLGKKPDPSSLEKISPWMEKRFDHLSLGQRRQVELSFILSMNFKILLLDEPLSPLDQNQRKIYSEAIEKQASLGSLVFVTSHQENEFTQNPTKVISL
jgi:ABC-type multidrug transport system ATPase subunit